MTRLTTVVGGVLLALTTMGVAACASILGIDDRRLDPELAGASADGGGGGNDSTSGPTPDGSTSDDGTTADSSAPDSLATEDASPDSSAPDVGTPDAFPPCAEPCPLAMGLNHPFLMASDANNVYWTEFGDDLGSGNGSVKGCPIAGCGAGGPVVYAQGLTNPRGIAVDDKNLYFGTASYSGISGGIWQCAVGGCGGSPTRLAAATIPFGVAIDGAFVYWADYDDGTVHKIAKPGGAGGAGIVLYDAGVYDDAGNTVFSALQCVVDGPYLYFMDVNSNAYRLAVTGGTPVLMGTTPYSAGYGLTTDTANLYFGGSGKILRVDKNLPGSGVVIVDTVSDPLSLVFDSPTGQIYWANGGNSGNDGTIGRASTDGGGQHVIAASVNLAEDVTVSGNYVLWLSNGKPSAAGGGDPGTGAVWRAVK